jgi:hypothetical protein
VSRTRALLYGAVAVVAAGLSVAIVLGRTHDGPRCGPGFVRVRSRCCATPAEPPASGECAATSTCPPPLVTRGTDCASPQTRVQIPETTLVVGPGDWEAEGLVAPRTVHAGPFQVDAFEVTRGELDADLDHDRARAATRVSFADAEAFCASRGGRLPTDDEWTVAAAGAEGRRYPWGDTGAVCRRAAWGLEAGPCARDSAGPDTVGAHPDGATPLGVHDLAGNVAEWTRGEGGPVARGGSFATTLATGLRVWARDRPDPAGARDVGFRCVYPP